MKRRVLSLVAILIFPVVLFGQEREWLRNSDLVFKGEVLKLFTSTVDWNDPSDLGLVRVISIIEGNDILQDYLQKPITVKFKNIRNVKPGQEGIFYARLWLGGAGLAVTEVGMKAVSNSAAGQEEEIRKERAQLQDDLLREQIRNAEHIVAGRIMSIRRLPVQTSKESEHDPVWTEAEIDVIEPLKGNLKRGERVKIVFAASNDIMWVRAPKFTQGQSGIWLLKKDVEATGLPAFVITNRTQFLDLKKRDDIKRLMQ